MVNWCALVNIMQHLFFVRLLDGVSFFCYRGRSGVITAIYSTGERQ